MRLTWSEVCECALETLLVPIAEDGIIASPDLLERGQDNEQEASITLSNLLGVPCSSLELSNISTDCGADGGSSSEAAGQGKMDTG
jgi:hypothetical protein